MMKTMLAMLLSCSLLFGLFACSAFAETPLLGGWNSPESPEITPELQEIFDQATEGLLGVNYTPVALIGTQVVAGMNYCFLCRETSDDAGSNPSWCLLYVWKAPGKDAVILEAQPIGFGLSEQS